MNKNFNYSFILRFLRKEHPNKVFPFLQEFKSAFQEAVNEELEYPEDLAIMQALSFIGVYDIDESLYKEAKSIIDVGAPESAGKGIAAIVAFLMQRISPEKRSESISNLKLKIMKLNTNEMASKEMPGTAAYGQAITFIKTVLNGHPANYISEVLKYINKNL